MGVFNRVCVRTKFQRMLVNNGTLLLAIKLHQKPAKHRLARPIKNAQEVIEIETTMTAETITVTTDVTAGIAVWN